MTEISTVDRGPRVVARSVTVNAPAEELFGLVNDPSKHGLVDGSGTVQDNVKGPSALSQGAKFTTAMRMYGVPYRITCTVTDHVDTPEYKVVSADTIHLYSGKDQIERISKAFMQNEVIVTELSVTEQTLEDYFMSITGGAGYV